MHSALPSAHLLEFEAKASLPKLEDLYSVRNNAIPALQSGILVDIASGELCEREMRVSKSCGGSWDT